jgi:hypothetical protein
MPSNDQDTVPSIADTDINCYLEQQSSLMTPQDCKWVKSTLNLHVTEYFTDAYQNLPTNSNNHINCYAIVNYNPLAGVCNYLQYVQGTALK